MTYCDCQRNGYGRTYHQIRFWRLPFTRCACGQGRRPSLASWRPNGRSLRPRNGARHANHISKAVAACDDTRATQRVRQGTLVDLQKQQLSKVDRLQAQLKADATSRHNNLAESTHVSAHGLGRLNADTAAVGPVVAKRKHRERRHDRAVCHQS